ncbi:histone-like nucleoid-structuring protein Lsr2 [Streptomyces sp. NPDC050095]|uniref:Lsr2 family DNA-binding protein n=1 Tax=unclassified Streptomyces TaxID=2593676 RepID=UPI003426025E
MTDSGDSEEQDVPDTELVKWFIRLKGLRREDDDGPVLPPEIRLFNAAYPSYVADQERRTKEREESARVSAESRAAAQRHYEHTKLMKDMREWGRGNGYFVGTRGRIPRKVIDAYREEKGL